MIPFRTFAIAGAALTAFGLAAAAKASSFGISVQAQGASDSAAPDCAIVGSYSTQAGEFGFSETTGAPGCSNSFSSPTAPGRTTATLSAMSNTPSIRSDTATATTDLSTASLHALGSDTTSPTNPDGGEAAADNQFWDTLTFTVAGATSSTVTNIPFTFSAHGSGTGVSPLFGPAKSVSAAVQVLPGTGCAGGVGCPGGAGEASWSSDLFTSSSHNLNDFDNVSYTLLTDTLTSFEVAGILSVTGPEALEYIGALLNTQAGFGTIDFSHTASFSFDLPSGVSFTSASGVFPSGSSSSVPEPGSLALLASGLLGLSLIRRRRLR